MVDVCKYVALIICAECGGGAACGVHFQKLMSPFDDAICFKLSHARCLRHIREWMFGHFRPLHSLPLVALGSLLRWCHVGFLIPPLTLLSNIIATVAENWCATSFRGLGHSHSVYVFSHVHTDIFLQQDTLSFENSTAFPWYQQMILGDSTEIEAQNTSIGYC